MPGVSPIMRHLTAEGHQFVSTPTLSNKCSALQHGCITASSSYIYALAEVVALRELPIKALCPQRQGHLSKASAIASYSLITDGCVGRRADDATTFHIPPLVDGRAGGKDDPGSAGMAGVRYRRPYGCRSAPALRRFGRSYIGALGQQYECVSRHQRIVPAPEGSPFISQRHLILPQAARPAASPQFHVSR